MKKSTTHTGLIVMIYGWLSLLCSPSLANRNYYQDAQECNPGERVIFKEGSWEVNKGLSLTYHTDQGKSPTCGYHAALAALNSLYKLRNPTAVADLNVLDAILKHATCEKKLESITHPVQLLLRISKERKLAVNVNRNTVREALRLNRIIKKQLRSCASGKCSGGGKVPHSACITGCCEDVANKELFAKFIDLANMIDGPGLEDTKTPIENLTRTARQKAQVEIPPFTIKSWDFLRAPAKIAEVIRDHGKSQPILPLIINTCVTEDSPEDCSNEEHAVAVKAYERIECQDSRGKKLKEFTRIWVFNSWGTPGPKPFDLDEMTEGMARHGFGVVSIQPCGGQSEKPCPANPLLEGPETHVLYHYADAGDAGKLRDLVSTGKLDPNLAGAAGFTPLHLAAYNGDSRGIAALLADKGTNPNLFNKQEYTPLGLAATFGYDEAIGELLADKRTNPNLADTAGFTPLYLAAQKGHERAITALLADRRTDPNLSSSMGTPAEGAIRNNQPMAAHRIIKHPRTNLIGIGTQLAALATNQGMPKLAAIILALESKQKKQIEMDLKKQIEMNLKTFHSTVTRGEVAQTRTYLEEKRIDPNHTGRDGEPALYTSAEDGNDKIAKVLLNRPDINPNQPGPNGVPPLVIASRNGNDRVVALLLRNAKTRPNLATPEGITALIEAAAKEKDRVVELLLRHKGINPNQSSRDGTTPLIKAIQAGREKNAKLLLARKDIDPNLPNGNGDTALSIAVEFGEDSIAADLLMHPKIDPNFARKDGTVPLSFALDRGNWSMIELLVDHPGIDLSRMGTKLSAAAIEAGRPDLSSKIMLKLSTLRRPPQEQKSPRTGSSRPMSAGRK